MSTTFASPAELATFMQTATQAEADAGSGDILDTGVATQALESASGYIRSVCNWNITEETATATVPVGDDGSLFLPTLYLTAVTVSINGVTLDGSQLMFWPNGMVELLDSYYYSQQYLYIATYARQRRFRYAVATFTHGYASVPDPIRSVCLERAAQMYENPTRKSQTSVGAVSDVYWRIDPTSTGKDPVDSRLSPYVLQALG